ncbi:helix-turn-helix transcriptional regulator [Natronobacterium texcoconense]|uniref:Predicted transcriptional regulator, contains HTH domain n=1 Tax=Natronobacterium texcoconense TaxID=1095778 RepID=A0A1H1HV21_NATTX|nr:ArsR family transcriptional regulator [Natronobacterium texcoconense]SDR29332.1 Predicted transcriptional regulator, contains HTH domain [Natronobacterium texcoconense]
MDWEKAHAAYMVLHKRLSIFKRLLDAPAYQNQLVDEVDASQSTVYRGLNQLEDHNLVEKQDGMYIPTTFGQIVYTQYDRTDEIVRTFAESKRLLETKQQIGTVLDPSIARNATTHVIGEMRSDLVYEYLEEQVSGASKMGGVVPTIFRPIVETYLNKTAANQLDAEFVFGKEATEQVQTKLSDEFKSLFNTGNFDAYSYSGEIPMGVVVITEPVEHVLVVIHDDIGVVRGIIDSKDRTAITWAKDWYSKHEAESTPLTLS